MMRTWNVLGMALTITAATTTTAFVVHRQVTPSPRLVTLSKQWMSESHNNNNNDNSNKKPGDKIRSCTGIRPSLHPTTINAISEALLLRSNPSLDPSLPMEVGNEIEPIEVAVAAGRLATNAIEKRAKSSTSVAGDEDSAFTEEECQFVAGRVVGVVMRWDELERLLVDRIRAVSWVSKYGEEGSFGVLAAECRGEEGVEGEVRRCLKEDPLLRMCRAESLLALFLRTVEVPSLIRAGREVDGDGNVDFLDQDRMEVLFPVE